MARGHYRPEEIIAKLREAEILLGQGMKVPEAVREIGIHEVDVLPLEERVRRDEDQSDQVAQGTGDGEFAAS